MIAQIDSRYLKTRPLKALTRLVSYSLFEGRPLTTKGQWINPLVFSMFTVGKKIPRLRKVKKPIFITGSGRSGTTILAVLMSMHRDVGMLNEPKALWHTVYPEEDVVGSYSRGHARFQLSGRQVTSSVRRTAHSLFGFYLAATFSSRLVDKYPELIFRIPFVRAIFPDAKFIFLVRNGWDTCYSIKLWSSRLGTIRHGEVHDWWGASNRKWKIMLNELVGENSVFSGIEDILSGFENHVQMAAVEWVITMCEGLRQLDEHSCCMHMLRYEDLMEDPERQLVDVLHFCELSHDEVLIKYAKNTLRRRKAHPKFNLHPSVQPLFFQTMQQFGYR